MNLLNLFRRSQQTLLAGSCTIALPGESKLSKTLTTVNYKLALEDEQTMSILSTIKTDVEKFFKATGTDLEKFADAFWKLFKKAPTALQTVENFVTEAGTIIVAVTSVINPAVGTAEAVIIGEIETALAAVQAAATAASTGTSLLTNLEAFFAAIPATATSLGLSTSSTGYAEVTKLVTWAEAEAKVIIPAVESWIATIKSSSKTPAAA